MAVVLVDLIGRQMQRCEGYFLGVELLWLEYAEALYDSLCARKRSVDALTIRVRICKRERSRLARHLIVPSAFLASSSVKHNLDLPNSCGETSSCFGPEWSRNRIVMRIATSNGHIHKIFLRHLFICYFAIYFSAANKKQTSAPWHPFQ